MKDAKDILSLSVPDFLDLYDEVQKSAFDFFLKMIESMKAFLKKNDLLDEWQNWHWGQYLERATIAFVKVLGENEEFKHLCKIYIENLRRPA